MTTETKQAKQTKRIDVLQNPEAEVPVEVLAEAITEIAKAAQRLISGPLTKRAVIVLIQDGCTGLSKAVIESVLNSAADLKRRYVTSPSARRR